jgi:hypothetical protein
MTFGLAACAVLLGASCGPADASAPPATFVGAVDTSDAVVGLAVDDRGLAFYVCGGSTSYASLTRWFSSTAPSTDGAFDATSEGWSVHGAASASAWRGTLTAPDGTTRTWAATASGAATLSGLYAAVDDGCRAGLVVAQATPDGAPQVQGTWCSAAGEFRQVTPIQPFARTDRGIRVRVDAPGGARELYLAPVLVPLQ